MSLKQDEVDDVAIQFVHRVALGRDIEELISSYKIRNALISMHCVACLSRTEADAIFLLLLYLIVFH